VSRPIFRAVPSARNQDSTGLPVSHPVLIGPSKFFRAAVFSLAAGLACVVLGCGVQGQPRPPRIERPVQIKDLAVIQRGRALVFSFTLPQMATDGERLTKPMEIEIFRSVTPKGSGGPGTSSGGAPWVVLSPQDRRPITKENKVVYTSPILDQEYKTLQGQSVIFTVRGVTHGFLNRALEGEDSNAARVTLLTVSGAVTNLSARATEKAVVLEWSPSVQNPQGETAPAPSGYRVFRSPTGAAGSYLAQGEVQAPPFRDTQFLFDRTYYYMVRALSGNGHSVAESDDSEAVKITPHDVFPPASPKNLTAVYAAGAVQIVWTASTEADFAGYNVLRSEAGGNPERVNKELLATPIFRDATAQPNRHYLYQVTAVDPKGNESTPSAAVEVETR
jgi:hypothetical protein